MNFQTSQNISFQIIASRNINSQIINTSFSNHAYTLKHSEHKYSQIIASNHKILESLLELFESLLELARIIKFSNHCMHYSKNKYKLESTLFLESCAFSRIMQNKYC